MKYHFSLKGLSFAALVSILMTSCSSDKVISKGPFQKRKYRKGFYVDLASKSKKDKAVEDFSSKNEARFNGVTKASATEELEVRTSGISPKSTFQSVKLPNTTQALLENTDENKKKKSIVEIAEKLSTNKPDKSNKTSIDPELRRSIVIIAVGVIIAILGVIGGILGTIFYISGSIIVVIGLVLLLLWLLDSGTI